MGGVEAGECLPPLSPKGCGEWSGETRATEEGPSVGAEGVGWTRALRDPGQTREMAGHVEGSVPQTVHWPSPAGNQGTQGMCSVEVSLPGQRVRLQRQ